MDTLTRPLTLQSGVSVTVHAWPYLTFTASFLDFRHLLSAFRGAAGGEEAGLPQQLLLDRVLLSSVPGEADRQQVMAADLPELLEAIYDLNRLEDVAAKPLSLYTRLLQAETGSLEALHQSTPETTSPD